LLLFVFAVILSAAKAPDAANPARIARTFPSSSFHILPPEDSLEK
jgi:hypothetical protein